MTNSLIDKIRSSVIGDRQLIQTSFGARPLVYADYTASGRSLSFIEDYIRHQVLPYYANTHTETSYTGAQSTALREQARDIIRSAVHASEDDRVIFCGPGATAAINKLIDILNLRLPADLAARYQLLEQIPQAERPVVFVGPYEHHSNELPWRESIADLEVIPLTADGLLDIGCLEQKLKAYRERKLKIGSFSAASNVTGIKTNIDSVCALLHKHDAVSFWDYAAAAPYLAIDMNHAAKPECAKDAVFISPHKFVGGPGTPGVLVVKKRLMTNSVPAVVGGGTVMWVTPRDHRFTPDLERREEGGTPAIVEAIRAGLVFKLQQAVGTAVIEEREEVFIRQALARWSRQENIEVLGSPAQARLSIVSLRIKHHGKDLHYGFVIALLNDLFGIQARGGCSCAGPYGHSLLGMDMAYSRAMEDELFKGQMVLRPGWVRLNFNYFIDQETFGYLVDAIALVAEYGWRLLPYYRFDTVSGTWRYQGRSMELASDLLDLDFDALPEARDAELASSPLTEYLAMARAELLRDDREGECYELHLPPSAEALRWFVLPQEAAAALSLSAA